MPHPLVLRQELKSCIRQFFTKREYLEVDTPLLVQQPGTEVHIDYFSTAYCGFKGEELAFSLRSSPELHMKQLLTQGFKRIFQMGPSFRNSGEYTHWHHPEFTLLEWYQTGISFDGMIAETDQLLRSCVKHFSQEIRPALPALGTLHRFTVFEAFKDFAGVELVDLDPDLAKKGIDAGCISPRLEDDFETAFFKIMMEKLEPAFKELKYVCLSDYPESQAILSKVEDGVAKRFEFYVDGIELCNAFLECFDPIENRLRMEETNKEREKLGKDKLSIDRHFLKALESGVPQACGNALGFDRWLAFLMGEPNLDSIIPFRQQFLNR